MTREEAKSMLPFMQAYAEGKTIQFRAHIKNKWRDVKELVLNGFTGEYRIKPELKCRPFKNQEECWKEMHKHPDFGWVTDGYNKSTISVKLDSIVATINSIEYDFEEAYIHFTFADDTPFGIKEE